MDTLTGPNLANLWTLSAISNLQSAIRNLLAFSAIENLIGGTGDDVFTLTNGLVWNGAINGDAGSDTLTFASFTIARNVTLTSVGSVDGFNGTESAISGGFSNINTLVGGSTNADTLTGASVTSSWLLGVGSTQVVVGANTLAFSGFESLIGGANNDTFTFANGATFNGTINGGVGTDTLDYSAYTATVTVNIAAGTATGTNGISNIEVITGGSGLNTITGDSGNNVLYAGTSNDILIGGGGDDTYIFRDGWGNDIIIDSSGNDTLDFSAVTNVTGTITFTFGASSITAASGGNLVTVNGVENFVGGNFGNHFVIQDGVMVIGNVSGGAGNDTLDLSSYATPRNVTLTSLGTVDGFNGTEASIGGEFKNINTLIGSALVGDTLTGLNASTTWNINAISHSLSALSHSLTFSNFELLNGGSGNDTFNLSGAQTFALNGNAGDDNFVFANNATLNGNINGGANTDTLDYSAYTTAVTVDLSTQIAHAVTGAVNGIENVNGGAGNDDITGDAGNNVLNGNGGNDTLIGGTGDDTYIFTSVWGTDMIVENANEGDDTMDFSAISTALNVTLSSVIVTNGGNTATYSGTSVENVYGGSASDTFTINGTQNVNLYGNAGDDTFIFNDSAALIGIINGGMGTDTLTFAPNTIGRDVALTGLGNTDGFAGFNDDALFDNINALVGSAATTDTLNGANTNAQWEIDGTNRYSVGANTLAFSSFETLVGGTMMDTFTLSGAQTHNLNGNSGDDTFVFTDNARLNGNIDGFGGYDTLDFSAYTTSRRIMLTGYDSEDGFVGTDTSPSPSLVGLFSHINSIIGSSDPNDPDLLIGLNNNATWDVSGTDQYHVNPTLDFSNFETLIGGSGQDTFNVNGSQNITLVGGAGNDTFSLNNGAQVTSVNGQGGADTLQYFNYTGPININTNNGTATNVPGGIGSIEMVMRAFPAPVIPVVPAATVVGVPGEEVITVGSLSGDIVPLIQTVATFVVVNHRAAANAPVNWVLFTAASGDNASVILEPITSLPNFMPTQYTIVSALKVAVMLNGQVMTTLPSGKTLTLSFIIPTSFATRNLAILYWDATLNNGAGGWVKLNIVIRQREQVTSATGWTTLPMKLFYWNDAAKSGTGDWVEVEVNALYNADGWIELPATIGSTVLTLTNAERRALTTVNFVGIFVLVAE